MDGSRLKIVYFSRSYTTHDWRFLTSFSEAGLKVTYLRLSKECLESREIPRGVEVISPFGDRGPLLMLRNYFALRRILQKLDPDVVLAGPVQTSAFLVAMTGYSPLISMSWGSDMLVDADRNPWMSWNTHYSLKKSAGVFCDCDVVRSKVISFRKFDADRILNFPWGVNFDEFSPGKSNLKLREKLGWNNDPVFISTRSWEPIYAVDVLVRAMRIVHQNYPRARLILLGSGSEDKRIRKLITHSGLHEFIHAPGRISYESLPDYFRTADFYVSTALSDGTSLSLLEAMGCGLPVIVTNIPGNLEWVFPGINGWLVPPQDPNALAHALGESLSNSSSIPKMKENNILLIREKANWNKNFPSLIRLLQTTSNRSRTNRS